MRSVTRWIAGTVATNRSHVGPVDTPPSSKRHSTGAFFVSVFSNRPCTS